MLTLSLPSGLQQLQSEQLLGEHLPDAIHTVSMQILRLLRRGPLTLADLEKSQVGPEEGSGALLCYALDLLAKRRIVETTVVAGNRKLAVAHGVLPMLLPNREHGRLVLSRFAALRHVGEGLLVETPFGSASVTLLSDEASLVCSRIARGTSDVDLCAPPLASIEEGTVGEILHVLDAAGALCDPEAVEDDRLRQWEHHDAMFHARIRGRMFGRRGGTYRFLGNRPPESAIPIRTFGDPIHLSPPTETPQLRQLQKVFEARRSIRTYSATPLTASELGTFLRQVARNLLVVPLDSKVGRYYEAVSRPYPGGGACHELEIFPIVHRCQGLARGLYWYDNANDALRLVAAPTAASERLLARGSQSMGIDEKRPDTLLCIAARFGRVNWKYEGIVYSIILKNVGVLLQTMYLVATAMGLAPCAIGAGDSTDFAEASGCTEFVEESVGEFALGRRSDLSDT